MKLQRFELSFIKMKAFYRNMAETRWSVESGLPISLSSCPTLCLDWAVAPTFWIIFSWAYPGPPGEKVPPTPLTDTQSQVKSPQRC
ncbi:hypothetical protein MHYP_G00366550 [Metynnis hypsauchen]